MFGWASSATARNSRLKRYSATGSRVRSVLTATRMSRWRSWTSKTSPMPPLPSTPVTSNRSDPTNAMTSGRVIMASMGNAHRNDGSGDGDDPTGERHPTAEITDAATTGPIVGGPGDATPVTPDPDAAAFGGSLPRRRAEPRVLAAFEVRYRS